MEEEPKNVLDLFNLYRLRRKRGSGLAIIHLIDGNVFIPIGPNT
jgi:hypothetical protein